MKNTIDQLFASFFGEGASLVSSLEDIQIPEGFYSDAQIPGVLKNNDFVVLFFELPGSKKEDILLSVDRSTNLIKVSSSSSIVEKYTDYNEKRSFNLPKRKFKYVAPVDFSRYDIDAIKAVYENGVLEVIISKKQERDSEIKIDIK